MGQVTIEIPQKVNRSYRVKSEHFLRELEHLVESSDESDANLRSDGKAENAVRAARMNWIKVNREKYAGKYVALDGENLVGAGETIREANEEAERNGVKNPFLVRISGEDEILSGGL